MLIPPCFQWLTAFDLCRPVFRKPRPPRSPSKAAAAVSSMANSTNSTPRQSARRRKVGQALHGRAGPPLELVQHGDEGAVAVDGDAAGGAGTEAVVEDLEREKAVEPR